MQPETTKSQVFTGDFQPFRKGAQPHYFCSDAAVGIEDDPPVTRRLLIDSDAGTGGLELNACRRASHKPDTTPLFEMLLMHVPPDDGPDVCVAVDDGEEVIRVFEHDRIFAVGTHIDRIVVKTDERMFIRMLLQ